MDRKPSTQMLDEMKLFASFSSAEQRYIRRSLDVGLNRRDITAGASWKYEFYRFDYAYVFNQRALGDAHQLSLILLF